MVNDAQDKLLYCALVIGTNSVISLGTFALLSTHTLLNFSKKGDLYKDWMNSLQFAQ
jgi:hypothetical protein